MSELNTTQIGNADYFITITDINVKAGDSNGTMRGTVNAEHHINIGTINANNQINNKVTLIRFDADITFVLEKKNGVFTDNDIKTEGVLFRFVSKCLLSNLGINAVFQNNKRLWNLFNIVFDGKGTYTITEKKPTATENTHIEKKTLRFTLDFDQIELVQKHNNSNYGEYLGRMNVIVEGYEYNDLVGRAVLNGYYWNDTGFGVSDLTLNCKTKNTEYNMKLGMNGIFQIDSTGRLQIDDLSIASATFRQNTIGAQFSDPLAIGRLTVGQTAKNRFDLVAQLMKSKSYI